MRAAVLILAALLAGCAGAPRVEIQRVNVSVPVECQEPVPARPVMPTDALRAGATVDDFTKAAQAEIERREGYEGELLTALEACRAPINPSRPDAGTQGSTP
ncbi:hypothetical protein QRO11_15240 [Paracidovorax citrulli]|uniref:Lipoprotein n=2 Tax=Paracidovorax citrulli TaxID=80869 RepID=A1TMY0_PARC0|nr:hypothetical protein [Paracidovorax citrulli]ABM32318.1 conserved hypothetical protein [Paracidovorax citrulli AAC00-1]ATG94666.1 hypothetical protein CQB05_12045 [Paracidovorax citrulli]MVT38604.1 hypothetical protein [Paracidovorax citrulli]PVY66523.1 hypothetical protein C8E08_3931 [Paracidovorax citrulli]QCX12198.1 hypothetical protein APS58_3440 [Paracidovorax citrulli]